MYRLLRFSIAHAVLREKKHEKHFVGYKKKTMILSYPINKIKKQELQTNYHMTRH